LTVITYSSRFRILLRKYIIYVENIIPIREIYTYKLDEHTTLYDPFVVYLMIDRSNMKNMKLNIQETCFD
jgi:hypothetical protein